MAIGSAFESLQAFYMEEESLPTENSESTEETSSTPIEEVEVDIAEDAKESDDINTGEENICITIKAINTNFSMLNMSYIREMQKTNTDTDLQAYMDFTIGKEDASEGAGFKAKIAKIWAWIKEKAKQLKDLVIKVWNKTVQFLSEKWKKLTELGEHLKGIIKLHTVSKIEWDDTNDLSLPSYQAMKTILTKYSDINWKSVISAIKKDTITPEKLNKEVLDKLKAVASKAVQSSNKNLAQGGWSDPKKIVECNDMLKKLSSVPTNIDALAKVIQQRLQDFAKMTNSNYSEEDYQAMVAKRNNLSAINVAISTIQNNILRPIRQALMQMGTLTQMAIRQLGKSRPKEAPTK